MVVLMGGFWLGVLGIFVVFFIVFMVVVGCERDQHEGRTKQNDHR
jgi:uncharacterized membrane protein